jgi:hypothetical protein
MQKWEYLFVTTRNNVVIEVNGQLIAKQSGLNWSGQNSTEYIKKAGLEGWEALNFTVQGNIVTYFFKRPVE